MIITKELFKEKINDILIVQFSATWCGPCKSLSKTIEAINADLANPIYKMDIDDHQELASTLNIRSVPALIRFENGNEVNRIIGNRSADVLKKFAS